MNNETISALQVALDTICDDTRGNKNLDAETAAAITALRGMIALGLAKARADKEAAITRATSGLNAI